MRQTELLLPISTPLEMLQRLSLISEPLPPPSKAIMHRVEEEEYKSPCNR